MDDLMSKRDNSIRITKKHVRMAVSIMAAIFLVILYLLIFFFSGQDGETSGSLSHEITQAIVEGLGKIIGGSWTEEFRLSMVTYWEHPVRKLAHFSEYAVMGILVWTVWRPWKVRDRRLYLLVILWVFVSASLDEGHQLLVEGRYGSFMDVLLDTSGGCFGTVLCTMAEKLWGRMRRKDKRKKRQKKNSKSVP